MTNSLEIPPWTIPSGLGALSRDEICDLLALFQDAELHKIIVDRVQDIVGGLRKRDTIDRDPSFQKRLANTASELRTSNTSNAQLRSELWLALCNTMGTDSSPPFSWRYANTRAADLAQGAADQLSGTLKKETTSTLWELPSKIWGDARALFRKDHPAFGEVVGMQCVRLLAEAAEEGRLDSEIKKEIETQIRKRLEEIPPELRDETIENAIKTGDIAAFSLLASGSSLIGLGLAVEIAGFSAYILAAQASAIIPLVGGKTLVSTLFVVSHPFFVIPVLAASMLVAGRVTKATVLKKLASSLIVLLSLRGLSAGRDGLAQCIDEFKAAPRDAATRRALIKRENKTDKRRSVEETLGGPLERTPGRPEHPLSCDLEGDSEDLLRRALFPDERQSAKEVAAVFGLTIGDIVYNAAAIDPFVVAAADFSRVEDIDNIFQFGEFAERLSSMSEIATEGATNNLRGYVAEQVVATRLVESGHQVSFPGSSNQPGYDLLVDGQPFQVKCLQDVDGLREHFLKYPDVPVIANAELVDQIAGLNEWWTDQVHFVEGYDLSIASSMLNKALEGGAALDDVDVPIFAVAVSVAKNIHAVWQGSRPLGDLPFEVAVDGAIKGGLAGAGGFTGSALGLLIFGPAGAVVFGAVGGAGALFGSGWVRGKIDEAASREWLKGLRETTIAFERDLDRLMLRKIDILKSKANTVSESQGSHSEWVRLRLCDEAVSIAECRAELIHSQNSSDVRQRSIVALRLMREASVHPGTIQGPLKELLETVAARPSIADISREATSRTGQKGRELFDRTWEIIKEKSKSLRTPR